jgi:heptosyltransferase-2
MSPAHPEGTRIGIFLPNWLGDLVMATPTLRAVRRHFGRESRVVGIVRPNLTELLAGTDWLDEQWAFDPRAKEPAVRRWALVERMRHERFDLVMLLTNSFDTALLTWLGGARRRVGYVRYGRGLLLTGRLYPQRSRGRVIPAPVVETYLRLAEAVGCPPEPPRLELATTEPEQQLAEEIWRRLGLRTDGRVIALNSSGAYGAAKLWPAEHFAELARRVADELDHDVLVVCGPNERQTAREIVRRADRRRVFSLADQRLGLGTSKACIRRSRLMVSTDSGPRHIAAAFGRPVITLLGPTLRTWIENPTVREVFVSVELDCLGCGKRVCPLGHHRCMRKLMPDRVYAEVVRLLEAEQQVQAA